MPEITEDTPSIVALCPDCGLMDSAVIVRPDHPERAYQTAAGWTRRKRLGGIQTQTVGWVRSVPWCNCYAARKKEKHRA